MLVVALGVRLWGLGFGLPFGNARPDETALAGPAVQFLSGNLRPPYFMYPTFLMYVVSLLYVLYWALGRPFTGYATLAAFAESRRQSLAPFFYLSRGVSAVMGTLTVWWITIWLAACSTIPSPLSRLCFSRSRSCTCATPISASPM